MRDHETEGERAATRPAPAKAAESEQGAVTRAAAAAATGRTGAIGASGVIRLQRTAGNAGVSSVLGGGADADLALQRAMGGGEAPKPLYPSPGEGEEEI